jgi:hypothetical protein
MAGGTLLGLLSAPVSAHQQNGNPDPTNPANPVGGRHDVTVSKAVSLIRSKPDGCSFNPTGDDNTNVDGDCTAASSIDVSSPTFGGTPNQGFTILVCNAKRAAGTDQGGDNDPTGGCDSANARGLSSVPGQPASSGTFLLNGSGNMVGGTGNVPASGKINVLMTSCNGATGSAIPDLLKALGAPPCTNANATTTCPPTQGQISLGWTCIVNVAEFDPVALTAGTHVGFRDIELKSPIPSKLCNNAACGATIPAGTSVKLTGFRFPCKVIQPDDPAVTGRQASCLTAHTNKTILMKRSSTGLLEGGAITPTSQTAGVNGDYVVTFTMPTLLHPGELYKIVPHAQDCVFNQGNAGYASPSNWIVKSCESGKFNAAGVTFKQ